MKGNYTIATRCNGFTILEVLIALLVLMMGMVAIAGAQTMAMSHNHSAFLRSQAIIQAHDMADRLYANPDAVKNGSYGVTQSNPTPCLTSLGAGDENLALVDCTADELAYYDLKEWNDTNANVLPSGAGTVTGPVNGIYTITLTWTDNEQSESFSFEVKPLP